MPALRFAAATADLETRRRVVLIMERIEDRLVIDELLMATPVSFAFRDTPVDDALRVIEKQTGLQGGTARGGKPSVHCDTGLKPFWRAWREFCKSANLQETDYAKAPAKLRRLHEADLKSISAAQSIAEMDLRPRFGANISFAGAPSPDLYSVDDLRSVRVRVRWHELNRMLDDKIPHAVFAVEIRAEPRLEIVKLPRVEILKVVNEKGEPRPVKSPRLIPETSRAEDALFLSAYAGEIQFGGLLQLKAIPWEGPPASVKEVHGRVHLDILTRPRLMEIPDVAKSIGKVAKSFQGITMRVLEADQDEEGEIQLRVHLDNLGSLAPVTPEEGIVRVRPGVIAVRGEIDVALERLELYNSAGRKCQLLRARYERAGKGKGYEAELTFATSAEKAKALTLVMTKAARSVPVEMPFVVRDVKWAEK
jgi:hypothetical protein